MASEYIVPATYQKFTLEQERQLIRQAQRALRLAEQHPETYRNNRYWRKGNESLQLLVSQNMLFVASIAKHYAKYGFPIEDLIGEGSIGLFDAVGRFDLERQTDDGRYLRFRTYAAWWVRRSIQYAMDNHFPTVRYPHHLRHELSLYHRFSHSFLQLHDRYPGEKEVRAHFKWDDSKYKRIMAVALTRDASIIRETGGNDSLSLLVAKQEESLSNEDIDKLLAAIYKLEKRLRIVITHRYGLCGASKSTLDEVGRLINISKERVRQLENRAIKQLRSLLGATA